MQGRRSHALCACTLVLLSMAQQISGQTYATAISQFGVGSQILVYGQPQTYTATITTVFVGGTAPPPTGSLLFQNASTTLATFNLAQGTTSGSQVAVSYTDTLRADRLAAGIYNAYHVNYPGNSANGVTFAGTDSRNTLPYQSFQVLPASTVLNFAFTPFTLANFSIAFNVTVVNVNGTNALPEGNLFETITKVPSGAVVGNFSLALKAVDANTVQGVLPPGFNATRLLTIGNYQALYQYFPSPNFTQPVPLTVGFTVTNVTVPAPPPPPGAVPPPPPPPSNGLATTIVLEGFFNQKKTWLHGCVDRELIFLASVRGPTPQQVPTGGTMTFSLQPGNVVVGSGTVQTDPSLGSASFSFVSPADAAISGYGYGQHTVVATYSGNGAYLPSQATAALAIPDSCDKLADIVRHVTGVWDVTSEIIHSEPYYTPGNGQYYGYGNGYDGYGYPQGYYLPGTNGKK